MRPEKLFEAEAHDPSKIHRVLAVRLDNIGDVIMLGPALRHIHSTFSKTHITLMASPAGSQVASLLPWVDDVIVWRAVWQDISGGIPFDPERELSLVDTLRKRKFDSAFIFTSFSQSPYPPAYVCYLAGIPKRIGHSKEFGGGLLSTFGAPPPDHGHQVDRNLAVVELAGIEIGSRQLELHVPSSAQTEAANTLVQAGLLPGAPYILFAPGASCSARRYEPERSAVAARLLASRTGLPVVIAGSSRETGTLAPVIAAAEEDPLLFSLVGETDVPQLAALIQGAGLVLANNSASLHLADAFRRPMVILYSGTEYESQWEPRSSPARLLRRQTGCSPCFSFQCSYSMECMDIPPEEVVEAALSLLETPAASAFPGVGTHLHSSNPYTGSSPEYPSIEREVWRKE